MTDDGIDELKDKLKDAHITTETWHAFVDDVADDEDLVARIKARSFALNNTHAIDFALKHGGFSRLWSQDFV